MNLFINKKIIHLLIKYVRNKSMAEIITMPRLSDTMEEGKLIRWYKKVGDKISEGDILAEIKTDKVNQDFEVDVSGILLYAGLEEGESTKVDQILAIVGEE